MRTRPSGENDSMHLSCGTLGWNPNIFDTAFRKFDKRSYMETPPPRTLQQPPAFVKNDLARLIISMFNEATNALPCWDSYVKEKKVTTNCQHVS